MCEAVQVFLVEAEPVSMLEVQGVAELVMMLAKSTFPVMSKFSTWASGLQTVCVVLAW
jgi:hypothetical protein